MFWRVKWCETKCFCKKCFDKWNDVKLDVFVKKCFDEWNDVNLDVFVKKCFDEWNDVKLDVFVKNVLTSEMMWNWMFL